MLTTGSESENGHFSQKHEDPRRSSRQLSRQCSRGSFDSNDTITAYQGSYTRYSISGEMSLSPVVPAQSSEKTKSLSDYTIRQKITLVCLCVSNLTCFMGLSTLAPFFPKEAESRGVSLSTSGWIFGVFSLVQCITSPIFGKTVPLCGSKFQFLMGAFFAGCSTVLFGMLDMMPYKEDNGETFVVFAFLTRIFLGLGSTACTIATFAIAVNIFKENAVTVIGLLESANGVGLMLGPAVGGFLYEAFGFQGPFYFVGFFVLATVPVYWIIVQTPDENVSFKESNLPRKSLFRQLLSLPVVIVTCVFIFVAAASWIILDPTLEPHLRIFNLNFVILGFVFTLLSATYAILSPVAGRIAGKMKNSTPLLSIAFMAMMIGMFFLGPSPILHLDHYRSLWLDLVSLVMMGVGCGFAGVTTYDKILRAAGQAGMEETIALHAVVGGLWNCVYAFGEFVGPVLAGWLVETIQFPWCSTVIALADALMVICTLILWAYESKYMSSSVDEMKASQSKQNLEETDNADEKIPLIKTKGTFANHE